MLPFKRRKLTQKLWMNRKKDTREGEEEGGGRGMGIMDDREGGAGSAQVGSEEDNEGMQDRGHVETR